MTTLAQALKQATELLRMHDQATLEAEVLLAHIIHKPRVYLHAWPEAELSQAEQSRFLDIIRKRATGHPVAYLTGQREFWSLSFAVTPDALIPRPETELLVEQTLAVLPRGQALRVADLGTGSGVIAIALARERRHWQLYAVDRSFQCLTLARRNARRLGVDNLRFIHADWSKPLADHALDAIVANPPYIAEQDPHLRQGDVRFEPVDALSAGPKGLNALISLLADAPRVLRAGGWIVVEHGMEQAADVHKLFNNRAFTNITTVRDLAGLERVSYAQQPA